MDRCVSEHKLVKIEVEMRSIENRPCANNKNRRKTKCLTIYTLQTNVD